jgi:hypothetical protein
MKTVQRVCALAALTSVSLVSAQSSSTKTVAPLPPWYRAYGYNITQSLMNPREAGGSAALTRKEIAAILYDVRMSGGTVVRWITTDVWPQWRCGIDPEDMETGELDPAWFQVTQILLEEAARQNVRVVISLSHLSNGGFGRNSTDPGAVKSDQLRWAKYRSDAAGKDHYDNHRCDAIPGYHHESDQQKIFASPDLTNALSRRFITMVRHLVSFKALAAIELFNEPDFKLTHTDVFWSTTHLLRTSIRGAVKESAQIPLYSGVAAWDEEIVAAAKRQGDFADEPVITVHSYDDYTLPKEQGTARLQELVTYLRRIAPGKPLIVAEFGSSTSLTSVSQHQVMVDTAYELYRDDSIGLWVWGNWFSQPDESDYKWDFNHRSPVGGAYRAYAFENSEARFAKAVQVSATDPAGKTLPVAMTISAAGSVGNAGTDTWVLTLNGRRFYGASRAGVFPEYEIHLGTKTLPTAAVTYFVDRDFPAWLAITANSGTSAHGLTEYQCDGAGNTTTPLELLGIMADAQYLKWPDKVECLRSSATLHFAL